MQWTRLGFEWRSYVSNAFGRKLAAKLASPSCSNVTFVIRRNESCAFVIFQAGRVSIDCPQLVGDSIFEHWPIMSWVRHSSEFPVYSDL